MPVVKTMGAGSTDTASGELTARESLGAGVAPAITTSVELAVLGLPNLGYWVRQAAGVAVTVTPQFAIRETTGVGVPTLEWLDFQPATLLIVGQPAFFTFRFPAAFIRLSVNNGGLALVTVEIALGASI